MELRTTPKKQWTRLCISLPISIAEEIQAIADQLGTSRSQVIRGLWRYYHEKTNNKKQERNDDGDYE